MKKTAEAPQNGKSYISLFILILVSLIALTVPFLLILMGRPADGLAVIYFFPSIFFMVVVLASGKANFWPKLIIRVIVLLGCIAFVLLFKNAVPNNGVSVTLAIVGLIACIVFEYLAPGSILKKKNA